MNFISIYSTKKSSKLKISFIKYKFKIIKYVNNKKANKKSKK